MLWFLIAVLVLALLARRRTRKLGIAIGIPFVVVLLWAMQRSDFGSVWRRTENPVAVSNAPAVQLASPSLDDVRAKDLQLEGSGAPWRFSGKVVNLSNEYQINSATFAITRADCYKGAGTPDGCSIVWRGEQTVTLSLPPQQTRNFAADIWLHGSALRLKGTPKDQFVLVTLTGARRQANGPAKLP